MPHEDNPVSYCDGTQCVSCPHRSRELDGHYVLGYIYRTLDTMRPTETLQRSIGWFHKRTGGAPGSD